MRSDRPKRLRRKDRKYDKSHRTKLRGMYCMLNAPKPVKKERTPKDPLLAARTIVLKITRQHMS